MPTSSFRYQRGLTGRLSSNYPFEAEDTVFIALDQPQVQLEKGHHLSEGGVEIAKC